MASFHKGFIKTHPLISVILYVLKLYLAFSTVSPVTTAIDPCYNYTVLDEPWRSISNTYASVYKCDRPVSWSGWYRLFVNNVSAHIPDTCVAQSSCGTYISLWIRGGHPTVTDGVVTRDVCGYAFSFCCFYGSFPIRVKACPDNYYVYELVSPTHCSSDYSMAYCADTSSINTSFPAVTPVTISPVYLPDPCYNYFELNDPWRAVSNTNTSVKMYDSTVSWNGWYRLFIYNTSAHIPNTCVATYSCGTFIPLWIRGGHPTVTDGVVTRDVCGNAYGYCCYFGSYPIKVKACPDNYYVYKLVRPTIYHAAYCAAVTNISTTTTVTLETTSAVSSSASLNTTVYILYAVAGLVIAVIILVVGLIAVRKTSAKTGSVTPVNKLNETRDKQKSDANDFEESVYENDIHNTDKSTPKKPINRPKESQVHTVYGNVQLNMG